MGGKKKKGGRGGRKKGDAAQFVQIIGLSKRKRNAKNAILTASTPHLDSARKAESIHSAPLKGTPPPPLPLNSYGFSLESMHDRCMRCGRKRGLTREGKKNVGFEADDGSILIVKKKVFLSFFFFWVGLFLFCVIPNNNFFFPFFSPFSFFFFSFSLFGDLSFLVKWYRK